MHDCCLPPTICVQGWGSLPPTIETAGRPSLNHHQTSRAGLPSPSKLTFMTAGASAPQGGVRVIFQSGSTESQNSQWVSFLQAEIQGQSVHRLSSRVLPQADMFSSWMAHSGREEGSFRGSEVKCGLWSQSLQCGSFLQTTGTEQASEWQALCMSLEVTEPASPACRRHLWAVRVPNK